VEHEAEETTHQRSRRDAGFPCCRRRRRTGPGSPPYCVRLMCIGLGVTAAAAHVVTGSPAIMQDIASNHILGVGALIVGLGLVLYLSARVQKMIDSRMQPVGPLTDTLRGLPRADVRGHGRDARGARGVRLDNKAEFSPGPASSAIWGSSS
jgi:hypothetical protein